MRATKRIIERRRRRRWWWWWRWRRWRRRNASDRLRFGFFALGGWLLVRLRLRFDVGLVGNFSDVELGNGKPFLHCPLL